MTRFQIRFDSADTTTVREACRALNGIGRTDELCVGLNGPDKWCGETPMLTEDEFMTVAGAIATSPDLLADRGTVCRNEIAS